MIKGMLNTEWVKAMLKKHGPLTTVELRKIRLGPDGDGKAKSLGASLDELYKNGELLKKSGNKWALATSIGWGGVFSAMKPATTRAAA